MKKVLAFDYGASSGRAMLGTFDGNSITLKEIHRFSNDPVTVNGTMYWDILRLFHEMKQGLIKANLETDIESIGVDTWGVDFGLLDKAGNLLENPVHYRDARTQGTLEKSTEKISNEDLYNITGNQLMEINTAFQLLSLAENRKDLLERADTLLLMPDLFNYLLTGVKASEYSIASTTQLLDAKEGNWSLKVREALSIPGKLFAPIIPSATRLGTLTDVVCEELNIKKCEVVAVAGHDTQCALAAVPSLEDDFIFISCGTWSLFGTELDTPLINEKTAAYNITNEGGYGGKASFLKNLTGLWLIQESRRQWMREGKEYGFGELEQMASDAKPLQCFIDTDAPEFAAAGNIPKRIKEYCERTGQKAPESIGEVVRCINESLAMKYRMTMEEIISCTGKTYDKIYMVGGGIQSKLLCQLTADACGKKVTAGPAEATVFGNIALQLIALGELKDLKEARKVTLNSPDISNYEPKEKENWDKAYETYISILKK